MTFDPAGWVRPHIRSIEPYQPIYPFEVIASRLGRPAADILKLDANENPYGPIPAVREALARLPYPHIYPDPESRSLRSSLAAFLDLPQENILAGAGADELIDLVMPLFLEPGDAIVSCPPTFGMYSFDAAINAARTLAVPRKPDFSLDLERLLATIEQHRPKLVFLAAPNNPDGGLVPADQLEQLLAQPVVIVLDEAYVEFAPPEATWVSQVTRHPNLIVLRTFSKWAGLAGLRVGYGVFPTSLMPHLWKIKQPYNVSQAAQVAAEISLENVGQLLNRRERIVKERGRLSQALQTIPFLNPYPSQANFVLCAVTGRSAAALKETLAEAGILVRHFAKPGLEDHIRISVGRPEDTDRLVEALEELE